MQDASFITETLAAYNSDEVFLQLAASALTDL